MVLEIYAAAAEMFRDRGNESSSLPPPHDAN
jgi:hypothetical protein